MVANAWVSTWAQSALRAADIEPTPYAVKAMQLWNKSTPTEPWSMNPIGIPSKGYSRRSVPGTSYALFLKYSEFSNAFAKAMRTDNGLYLKTLLQSGESTAKLWRSIQSLEWPGSHTENDYPRDIHEWIGDEFRALLNIPDKTPHRSSGTVGKPQTTNHQVLQTQRAMITAIQTKRDLADAILFIVKGVK